MASSKGFFQRKFVQRDLFFKENFQHLETFLRASLSSWTPTLSYRIFSKIMLRSFFNYWTKICLRGAWKFGVLSLETPNWFSDNLVIVRFWNSKVAFKRQFRHEFSGRIKNPGIFDRMRVMMLFKIFNIKYNFIY